MSWKEDTKFRKLNILNLEYDQFPGVGPYDIPEILPEKNLPDVREWVGFNYALKEPDPEGKGVHFFLDDYQFERVWTLPGKYIDRLSRFACVAAPDFSPFADMPVICQIWNHYRKHWIARYWQEHGITVIPTIRCNTDPRSLEWYLDGVPPGGAVMISSMWANTFKRETEKLITRMEYCKMRDTLKPEKIFLYGEPSPAMGILDSDPIVQIKSFTDRRFAHAKREQRWRGRREI